jgi:hypothetical protein
MAWRLAAGSGRLSVGGKVCGSLWRCALMNLCTKEVECFASLLSLPHYLSTFFMALITLFLSSKKDERVHFSLMDKILSTDFDG